VCWVTLDRSLPPAQTENTLAEYVQGGVTTAPLNHHSYISNSDEGTGTSAYSTSSTFQHLRVDQSNHH
jgi:hypothetical protein